MPWKKIKPSMTAPRLEAGVDYSMERIVLLRKGSRFVGRRPGFTGWTGVGCVGYYQPEVSLYADKSGWQGSQSDLFEGPAPAELSPELRERIAKHLDMDVSNIPLKLPRGFTLIWED